MSKLWPLAFLMTLFACVAKPPLATVDYVDVKRFMGDWYVIANIPTAIEVGAHNAVESYALNDDGTIATTFTYLDGSFDGQKKTMTPKGFVKESPSNAEWLMQFVWPFKADYRIIHLAPDYSTTVIGRNKRDYVWIMARSSHISDVEYQTLVEVVADAGYDTNKLVKVPQRWAAEQ